MKVQPAFLLLTLLAISFTQNDGFGSTHPFHHENHEQGKHSYHQNKNDLRDEKKVDLLNKNIHQDSNFGLQSKPSINRREETIIKDEAEGKNKTVVEEDEDILMIKVVGVLTILSLLIFQCCSKEHPTGVQIAAIQLRTQDQRFEQNISRTGQRQPSEERTIIGVRGRLHDSMLNTSEEDIEAEILYHQTQIEKINQQKQRQQRANACGTPQGYRVIRKPNLFNQKIEINEIQYRNNVPIGQLLQRKDINESFFSEESDA